MNNDMTKTVLTFDEITEFVLAHATDPTTPQEVEAAMETLVADGIIETLWGDDGRVSYRLTRHGVNQAMDMAREEGW